MVANRASTLAVTVTALLFAASAHGQSGPVSASADRICAAESSQPPCLSIGTGPNLELPLTDTGICCDLSNGSYRGPSRFLNGPGAGSTKDRRWITDLIEIVRPLATCISRQST